MMKAPREQECSEENPFGLEVWTTKDGQKLKIKDMEKSHILNSLKMLLRNFNTLVIRSGARNILDCTKEWNAMDKPALEKELGELVALKKSGEDKRPILYHYLLKHAPEPTEEEAKILIPEPTKESFKQFYASSLLSVPSIKQLTNK